MACTSWLIAFLIVGIVSFTAANLARLRRDGVAKSNETIHGLPSKMGFSYKNDCNDENTWTN